MLQLSVYTFVVEFPQEDTDTCISPKIRKCPSLSLTAQPQPGLRGGKSIKEECVSQLSGCGFFGRILDFCRFDLRATAQKRSVLVNKDSNVTPKRSLAVKASDQCLYPLAATLATLCLPGGRSPTFSKWAGTRRGKTADQTVERSTPRLLTSIVIHQSKAIILLLMKFQFAFSAFHIDIFHIATEL